METRGLAIKCRVSLPAITLLTAMLPSCLHAAPSEKSGAADDSKRMVSIRALRLESIPGAMPTFYSPHSETRAKYLQGLLGGEIAYYSKQFHVDLAPVTMAVLDAQQWPKVAGDDPYGMPSVDGTRPAVFVMPACWKGVTWMVVPSREEVPLGMLRKALANGKKWNQVKFEGCDGIGTHEIGHSIIRQLGIDPQTRWFNEFLASYAGYAYLKDTDPEQALSNEIFWTVGLNKSPHWVTKVIDRILRQILQSLDAYRPVGYDGYPWPLSRSPHPRSRVAAVRAWPCSTQQLGWSASRAGRQPVSINSAPRPRGTGAT